MTAEPAEKLVRLLDGQELNHYLRHRHSVGTTYVATVAETS